MLNLTQIDLLIKLVMANLIEPINGIDSILVQLGGFVLLASNKRDLGEQSFRCIEMITQATEQKLSLSLMKLQEKDEGSDMSERERERVSQSVSQ